MEEMERSNLFTKYITYTSPLDYEDCIVNELRFIKNLNKIALNISESDPSSDGLNVTSYNMLLRSFKRAEIDPEIVSSASIMKLIRGRKSDEEIEKIKKAVDAAMEIYDEARSLIKVGMSGKDVQNLFKKIINSKGLGYSWHEPENPYVSVGIKSSYLCKMPPDDVFIEPGDLVNVDLGIKLDGFASDNQRSFYALRDDETSPPEDVVRAFKTIKEINETVCKSMKVLTNSNDLTKYGDEIMIRNGYSQGFKGSYGHEIGIFAHNGGISAGYNPFKPELDKTLEYNMTFTLEPAIITSCGRLCQEEVVVCKKYGGEFLSRPQEEIWIINK